MTAPWKQANHERILEEGRRYYLDHIEERKAYWKAYIEPRREQERARLAKWREEHREHERARGSLYHAANPGKATERMVKWRAANPDRSRETIRRYRTLKLKAYVEHIDFQAVFNRDGGICQICRSPVERIKATLDHVIPLSRGGLHAFSNVQIAHGRCNSSKGAKLLTRA